MSGYPLALALTLGVEVSLVAAVFPGRRARLATVCALTTTATHLALHFVFPHVLPARAAPLVVGEAIVTVLEAAAYWAASRDLGRSLVASGLANVASFALGLTVL
jgi:uncharacterized protein (DUF1810 family)